MPYRDPSAKRAADRAYHQRMKADPAFREANARRNLEWKRRNPGRHNASVRWAYFKGAYGMTLKQRDTMLVAQGGVCAICHRRPRHRLHIDHDHKTGKVRQLLCSGCNTGLGKFQDDPGLLRLAIEYLERHGQ